MLFKILKKKRKQKKREIINIIVWMVQLGSKCSKLNQPEYSGYVFFQTATNLQEIGI